MFAFTSLVSAWYVAIKCHSSFLTGLLDSFQSSPAPSTTSASPTSVAFTAVLTTNLSNLGAGQTIKFNQIVTNVGGCYHPSHGNFIAPSDGVYVFSVTAMAINGHYEHMHIVKDGVGMIAIFGGPLPAGAFESTTVMVTLDLAKGNEVWVQTVSQSWHGSGTMHGAWDVSFSGWRLS